MPSEPEMRKVEDLEGNTIGLEYPAAKTIFECAKKEYDYEDNRKREFDTRSGICIAFIGSIVTLSMSKAPTEIVATNQMVLWSVAIPYVLYGLFFMVSIIIFLISMYYFMKVMFVRVYKRLYIKEILPYLTKTDDYVQIVVSKTMNDYIEYNGQINEKKAKFFQRGASMILIAIGCDILSYLMLILGNLLNMK